jgi:hypothetical protein
VQVSEGGADGGGGGGGAAAATTPRWSPLLSKFHDLSFVMKNPSFLGVFMVYLLSEGQPQHLLLHLHLEWFFKVPSKGIGYAKDMYRLYLSGAGAPLLPTCLPGIERGVAGQYTGIGTDLEIELGKPSPQPTILSTILLELRKPVAEALKLAAAEMVMRFEAKPLFAQKFHCQKLQVSDPSRQKPVLLELLSGLTEDVSTCSGGRKGLDHVMQHRCVVRRRKIVSCFFRDLCQTPANPCENAPPVLS